MMTRVLSRYAGAPGLLPLSPFFSIERARVRSVGIASTAFRKPSWVPVLSTPVPLTLLITVRDSTEPSGLTAKSRSWPGSMSLGALPPTVEPPNPLASRLVTRILKTCRASS